MLVPTIDQINVIPIARSAPRSEERKSVLIKPNPTDLSNEFNRPSCAKNLTEIMPITTQDKAVGRK